MSDDLKVETLTPEEIARACDESAVHPFHASICRVCLQRLILAAETRGRIENPANNWREWACFVFTDNSAETQALPDIELRERIANDWGKKIQVQILRAEAAEARLRELEG